MIRMKLNTGQTEIENVVIRDEEQLFQLKFEGYKQRDFKITYVAELGISLWIENEDGRRFLIHRSGETISYFGEHLKIKASNLMKKEVRLIHFTFEQVYEVRESLIDILLDHELFLGV